MAASPSATRLPYTTLFRSRAAGRADEDPVKTIDIVGRVDRDVAATRCERAHAAAAGRDRSRVSDRAGEDARGLGYLQRDVSRAAPGENAGPCIDGHVCRCG